MAYCTFCNIIAGREPATVLYEDDEVLVFRNLLRWLPVMLLAVPKRHLSQEELWTDLGPVGRVAVEVGRRYCPSGFRLVSNFGWDALQSQSHAHVHVLGGGAMDAVGPLARVMEPVLENDLLAVTAGVPGDWPPVLLCAEPRPAVAPETLWEDMGAVGAALVQLGRERCPGGFRLMTNIGWDALQTTHTAHVYLLGGDELGHYV